MALYTKEQIDKANSIDLEEYLTRRGEKLKRTGSESVLVYKDGSGNHDSISIRKNRWYDHKNGRGGYTVKFLQEFYGMKFRDAMKELLTGESPALGNWKQKPAEKAEEPKKAFVLPKKADNMKRLYAYLIKTRFISKDVVQAFVDARLIYQEGEYNNIVFVGTDKHGVPKAASRKSTVGGKSGFKMTVAGSDAEIGFCWRGTGEKLFVFEAAVDLLSYLTLHPENWQEQSYLALDGLSPKPLMHFVSENPHIKEVNLCTDYDAAGIEVCDKFKDLLMEKGFQGSKIMRLYPMYKDWNEQLKALNGMEPLPPSSHPQKDAYHKFARNLVMMNIRVKEPYIQWKEQGFQKGGIQFYVEQIKKEWKQVKLASGKEDKESQMKMRSSLLRMADLSVGILTQKEEYRGMEKVEAYQKIFSELEIEYRPYLDKGVMAARIGELEKTMKEIPKEPEEQALFSCAKTLADMAVRTEIYMTTTYPLELERRKAFQERQTQDIGMAMGG